MIDSAIADRRETEKLSRWRYPISSAGSWISPDEDTVVRCLGRPIATSLRWLAYTGREGGGLLAQRPARSGLVRWIWKQTLTC